MSDAKGFVQSEDLPSNLSMEKLHIGQVALFRVKEKTSASTRVIMLSAFIEMNCIGEGNDEKIDFKHLMPGCIVQVEPQSAVSDGIFVEIKNGGFLFRPIK